MSEGFDDKGAITPEQSSGELLSKSELAGAISDLAGRAYVEGVNPVGLFDLENGNTGVETVHSQVRDEVQRALSDKVLHRGEAAQGTISRAELATRDDILDVAVSFFKRSLIHAADERNTDH